MLRHSSNQLDSCKQALDDFNALDARLGDAFDARNENILCQLDQNKHHLNSKYNEISTLYATMRCKYAESVREHQSYLRLIDAICAMIERAATLITRPKLLLNSSCSSNEVVVNSSVVVLEAESSLTTNRSLKEYARELNELETRLGDAYAKLKQLNIKDAARLSKICELTSPCTQMLNKLRETRVETLDCVQERDYLLRSRLGDVEAYVRAYVRHRDDETAFLRSPPSAGEPLGGRTLRSLSLNELARLLSVIKYMSSCDAELARYERLCVEMSAENDDADNRLG